MSLRPAKILFLVATLLAAWPAFAQTYEAGFEKYRRADLKGCIKSLQQALPSQSSRAQKARTLKLLGICQFTAGEERAAAGSFREALSLDPTLAIEQGESLDDDVIPLFEKQRGVAKSSPSPSSSTAAAPPAPVPDVAAAPGEPDVPSVEATFEEHSEPARKRRKKKGALATRLKVISNAPAQVFLEGIIAGPTGKAFDVDPTDLEIEVIAEGYEPQTKSVTAVEGETTEVRVKLEKAGRGKSAKKDKKERRKKEKLAKRKKVRGRKLPQREPPPADLEREFAAESGDPYGQYGAATYQEPMPPPDMGPDPQGRGRASAKEASGSNFLVCLLPFGAGQLMHESYLLGAGFALAEAGALYFGYSKLKSADVAQRDYESYRAVVEEEAAAKEEAVTADDQDYLVKLEKYADDEKVKAYIGFGVFAGVYALGVFEAMLTHAQIVSGPAEKKAPRASSAGKSDVRVTLLPTNDALAPAPAIAWRIGF